MAVTTRPLQEAMANFDGRNQHPLDKRWKPSTYRAGYSTALRWCAIYGTSPFLILGKPETSEQVIVIAKAPPQQTEN